MRRSLTSTEIRKANAGMERQLAIDTKRVEEKCLRPWFERLVKLLALDK